MKVLLDSSVLIAAMVSSHPEHARALPWLGRAKAGKFAWFVAAHSLAEVYAGLTAIPFVPRIAPALALQAIDDNIQSAKLVPLSARDYRATILLAAQRGLTGGAIYDALIARAAQRARVDRLLTFNPTDFHRVWPDGVQRIQVP
ncbi:MAG: PIN domain-containing protein [Phycisphaeraceae bacterium]